MLITQNMSSEISPAGDNWQMVEFNMTNPSSSDVVVDLFDVNGLATPIPSTPSSMPPSNIIATTTVGANPYGIAVCEVSKAIYVANSGANSVSVIDGDSYLVISTIIAGLNPTYIAYNSLTNTMYVTHNSLNAVSVIDCATNTVITTITLGISATPQSITYNYIDNTMYVGCQSGAIDVIDCATNTVITTITVGNNFEALAYCPFTNTIYAPDYSSATVFVIDCATNTTIVSIPTISTPRGICYNSLNNTMYVCSAGTDQVFIISCATNTVIGSPISVGDFPVNSVYDVTNNQVYVTNQVSNNITGIECDTNTVSGTISPIASPIGIAYNYSNNSLFATSLTGSTVKTIAPFQTFYITASSFDYNQFVRDQGINPKIVRQIVLLTTASQLNNNIQILQKDMYGKRYVDNRIPNLSINKFMQQNTIAELDFSTQKNPLIFDCYTSFSQYTIEANTTLIMLIYYKEAIMSEKLNRSERAVMGTCINIQVSNCSQDATLKLEKEIPNFGEPVISIDEVLNAKK